MLYGSIERKQRGGIPWKKSISTTQKHTGSTLQAAAVNQKSSPTT